MPEAHPRLVQIIAETGMLLQGHFQLQGGEHSGWFLRMAHLGWDRARTREVAELAVQAAPWARQARGVLAPESSFLGSSVAHSLGTRLLLRQLDSRRRPTGALRGGQLEAGAAVVLVEDVVRTGQSLEPLLRLAQARRWPVAGVLVLATLDLARFERLLALRRLQGRALLRARWPRYPASPSLCPHCREGQELLPAAELS